jgi:peptide/nickel transport system permease protein
MLKKVITQPPFLIGFTVLILLMTASLLYSSFIKPYLPAENPHVLYDDNGYPYDNAPFEPSLQYPLGSDLEGSNYILNLLDGAKYTVGFAIGISIARVFLSVIGSIMIYLLPNRLFLIFKGIADAYHYAPLSFFAYFVVAPALVVFSWSYSYTTKVVLLVSVLIVLAFPIITIYLVNEMQELSKKEYIRASELLGANRFRIITKHMYLHLAPKIVVIFIQQVGQVLTLFAHLGLLEIFIGGLRKFLVDYTEDGAPILKNFSLSNEWGGLIAINFKSITSYPWLVFGPVTAFAVVILCINLMVAGINNANEIQLSSRKGLDNAMRKANSGNLNKESFSYISNEHSTASVKNKKIAL